MAGVGRTRRREPDAPAVATAAKPAQPSAWQRFNAHSPRYRVALVGWIVSIFLIPASVLLHSPAATAVAIVLTWLAIHNFRRVDAGERRAQAAADAQPDPDPGPDAPAVR
jgi:hypothetical protein